MVRKEGIVAVGEAACLFVGIETGDVQSVSEISEGVSNFTVQLGYIAAVGSTSGVAP